MEIAAGRRIGWVGDFAFEEDARGSPAAGVRFGNGRQERFGVGVLGVGVKFERGRHLDNFADVHDSDAIADMGDDAEIVGDEDVGEPHLFLQLLQEVEDLGLHRDIEGGDRFVGDDKVGLADEGAGDADALTLTAAECVGVTAHYFGRKADEAEGCGRRDPQVRFLSPDPWRAGGRRSTPGWSCGD